MSQIKFLLTVLFGGTWASSWWAAAVWGHEQPVDLRILWVIPALFTLIVCIIFGFYIQENWNRN